MKAIVYTEAGLPIEDARSLFETELPAPLPREHDLLVRVAAVAVNPVDTKVRRNQPTETPRILGWDAVGTVEAVGAAVTRFKPGDRVWYAGSIDRPGSYAELQCVDERIAGHAPATLDDAAAAALPLTTITAWELLFDRLGVAEGGGEGRKLLVVGAAGGVGSILVQLARKLTKLTVIGTASRPETADWVRTLGAHVVVDHSKPLAAELAAAGHPAVDYIASLTQTHLHYDAYVEAVAPQGRIGLIDDPEPIDVRRLKRKAVSLHWELMFTRPLFGTPDLVRQHEILERAAALVDAGTLVSTQGEHYGAISAANLRRAHALVESGRARGKLVLAGF
ncbi:MULTISPECIES: zinc-binding alcohol dehydrogenase family protein [unclassified Rubrivivax]|uniref:zinc-binding alcohol dehydrogenase family protein n=1 Tax=unclassified Rubrivivax TaxID=2649762 RepID=UPI001E52D046|nr:MULTISPECIES: zinc-binding alcohol dehydrogenase family protein [unclassified Rubrivivax]MCC9598851.1 zinc-binding alcohol dehydrogenase family protein [Rubrivivax sp. JA1055]MCC9648551.1 zinc-binding alcohol dehydrogenase family protein [Rubrivivax sp. JA1029]